MRATNWMAAYPYLGLYYQNQWLNWQTQLFKSWVDTFTKSTAKVAETSSKITERAMASLPTPMSTPSPISERYQPIISNGQEAPMGSVKLYEERLVADKNRYKIGEVALSKVVRTELARASVPVQKERVVVERTALVDGGQRVNSNEAGFQEVEVIRLQVFEESASIHKEAFVKEVVTVKKVVEQEIVTAEDTLRVEDLILNGEGNLVIQEQ